jgi:hypothetical protein
MSFYAQNSSVRLYALSFVSAPSQYVQTALGSMTTSTRGFYQHAPNDAQLNDLYTQIAGLLNEQAGGQTQMVTDFSTITVDGHAVTGKDVDSYLTYVYNPSGGISSSTYITKYTAQIPPPDPPKNYYYATIRDDSGNWSDPTIPPGRVPKKLEFDVGKIILNDVWMTNLQFKINKAGQIELFGDTSPVTFYDITSGKTQTVYIPSNITNAHEIGKDTQFGLPVTL